MSALARMREIERLVDQSRHTADCADRAARRAWNNDHAIADYPSPEATRKGLGYLGAEITQCTCRP